MSRNLCGTPHPTIGYGCRGAAGHDGDHYIHDAMNGTRIRWTHAESLVPASALDAANEALRAANEEIARLTDALHNARSRAWSHVLAGHEPSRRTVEHIDAALAPKESADE